MAGWINLALVFWLGPGQFLVLGLAQVWSGLEFNFFLRLKKTSLGQVKKYPDQKQTGLLLTAPVKSMLESGRGPYLPGITMPNQIKQDC